MGSRLHLVHGRDSGLSLGRAQTDRVESPRVESFDLGRPILDLEVGTFIAGDLQTVAVLFDNGEIALVTPETGNVEMTLDLTNATNAGNYEGAIYTLTATNI